MWIEVAQANTHAQLCALLAREQFFQGIPFEVSALIQVRNPTTLNNIALFAGQLASQFKSEMKGARLWRPAMEGRERTQLKNVDVIKLLFSIKPVGEAPIHQRTVRWEPFLHLG